LRIEEEKGDRRMKMVMSFGTAICKGQSVAVADEDK